MFKRLAEGLKFQFFLSFNLISTGIENFKGTILPNIVLEFVRNEKNLKVTKTRAY